MLLLTQPHLLFQLGTSPLHFSSQYGHYGTAEVLLRAGISRDARTKVDRTPLHVASQEGHIDIVNLLLQHSADIDAKDMVGQAFSLECVPENYFLISQPKHMLWVLKTTVSMNTQNTCLN